jgi:hypothetical protein
MFDREHGSTANKGISRQSGYESRYTFNSTGSIQGYFEAPEARLVQGLADIYSLFGLEPTQNGNQRHMAGLRQQRENRTHQALQWE